jgi:hypothetical protein
MTYSDVLSFDFVTNTEPLLMASFVHSPELSVNCTNESGPMLDTAANQSLV